MQNSISIKDAESTVLSTVSRALGTALITGIGHAEAEGHPLTELQQEDMAVMAIMAYKVAVESCEAMAAAARLMALRPLPPFEQDIHD